MREERYPMTPEHVTAHAMPGNVIIIWCGHCEGALRLSLPMKTAELVTACEQFGVRHHACKENDARSR